MDRQPSSLPNELLAEIFILGRTDNRFGYAKMNTRRIQNEILYSHVSRRWRDVAINLPALWTWIYIFAHSSVLWLPDYLSRSQPCHLNIGINLWRLERRDMFNDKKMNKITDMMNLLIPHIDRWSSLRVEGDYEGFSYLVLSRLNNLRAPVLREFIVHFEVEWMEENLVPFEILQGGAPLLSSIRLDMLQRWWPPVSASTTCSIHRFNHSPACMRFIQLLASSHALTKLRVHGSDSYNGFSVFDGLSRIQLDTLKSLRLDMNFRHSLPARLLLEISVPLLETLELESVTDSTLRPLFDSPQRSSVNFPALHTLSLNDVELDDNSYIQLSYMFPSITRLKVRNVCPSDFQGPARLIGLPRQLYERHARDTSDGGTVAPDIMWPKLHTIVLGHLRDRDPLIQSVAIADVLCDMLDVRRALGRPLEKLVLIDKVLKMVEGSDGLRGYLELWEHPYDSDDEL